MRMEKEGHEDPASHHQLGFTYISRASASSPLFFFSAENSLLLPGAKKHWRDLSHLHRAHCHLQRDFSQD